MRVGVRDGLGEDHTAIRRVVEAAFGQAVEADLIDALRASGAELLSLCAEVDGRVVGQVLFSPVRVHSPAFAGSAVGLAPMSVAPSHQRRGIGSLLVEEGLRRCRVAGHTAVFVLGHPGYYPRFGFAPASRFGLRSEYEVPDEVFMALELASGALDRADGLATYHQAFAEL